MATMHSTACLAALGALLLAGGTPRVAAAEDAADGPRFEFGGSVRVRGEAWDNFLFVPDASDSFALVRLLLDAGLRVSDASRLFVEVKAADATSRDLPGGRRPIDVDTLALQQAYFETRRADGSLAFRAGRMALRYGRERLVSRLPWGNSLRAWDGALMTLEANGWDVDAFWTYFVPVDKYDMNTADTDRPFRGIYARRALANEGDVLDLYWLSSRRPSVEFNGTTGAERRETFGMHLALDIRGYALDVEGALQTGRVGPEDISAAMLAVELTRPLAGSGAEVLAGLDFASGDDRPGGEVGTFHALYPLGHAYLGYIDAVGRQNVLAAHLGVRMPLGERLRLGLEGHTFHRARTEDALYDAGGGIVLTADASRERHVGEELDVTLTLGLGSGTLLFGYSRFFAGAFLDEGGRVATDFGYLQYQYTF